MRAWVLAAVAALAVGQAEAATVTVWDEAAEGDLPATAPMLLAGAAMLFGLRRRIRG